MIGKVTILHTDLRDEADARPVQNLSSNDPASRDAARSNEAARSRAIARMESACARRLTAAALSLYLGTAPSAQDLSGEERTPSGKPYFPAFPDFYHNISHSAGIVVCAVWERPIGIDLQQIPSDPARAMRIANRFFSGGEQEALRQLQAEDPASMLRLFGRFWTARESYIKLTGRGLAEPFENYDPDLDRGLIHPKSGEIAYITSCRAPQGYCMTLCSYEPVSADEILYQSVL